MVISSIIVLILIILEYIYIKEEVTVTGINCLNPYYTGIHLHIPSKISTAKTGFVLILIILEYIYIISIKKKLIFSFCLNPYYTGIHLHLDYEEELWGAVIRLNPYYTGIHLHFKSLPREQN